MYFIVKDNQVVGYADSQDAQLPEGFQLVQGPTLDPAEAMVEDGQIVPKPEPEPEVIQTVPTPDWPGLLSDLRGTALFNKAISTANPNAFSTLLFALGSSHNVQDLAFAIAAVRQGLEDDYTTEEIGQFNQLLEQHQIDLSIN